MSFTRHTGTTVNNNKQSFALRKSYGAKKFITQQLVSVTVEGVAHRRLINSALWITNQEVVKSVRGELLTTLIQLRSWY